MALDARMEVDLAAVPEPPHFNPTPLVKSVYIDTSGAIADFKTEERPMAKSVLKKAMEVATGLSSIEINYPVFVPTATVGVKTEDPGAIEKGTACYYCGNTKRRLWRVKAARTLICWWCSKEHLNEEPELT